MTAPLPQRVERICRDLIQTYLDLFIVLLAEQGADVDAQRERIDALVRGLGSLRVEDTLFVQGRRVPMVLEQVEGRPLITLNAELLARVEDDELLLAFGKPIASLLGLPTVTVGLVLQGHDEKHLRTLYHAAKSRVEAPHIAATQVPAVVEHRVSLFVARQASLLTQLARGQHALAPPGQALVAHLVQSGAWPEWDAIASHPFMTSLTQATQRALDQSSGQLPPASTLLELCWESLDLSPQSFLRHVGRALRTQQMAVPRSLLVAVAEVVAPGQVIELEDITRWPPMVELEQAWTKLYACELRTLGPAYYGDRQTRRVSVFTPVRDAMSLREPVELPFEHPLVCWSVREIAALRDLLLGLVKAHQSLRPDPEEDEEFLLVELPEREAPLERPPARSPVQTQVIGTTVESPAGYEQLQGRAWRANSLRMRAQFDALEPAQQLQILKRLRGAYDGFFPQTRPVWERRLQGWELDMPGQAFERLAFAVRDILDCPALLDPFESPESSSPRMIPHLCFIVTLSEHVERVPFKIPIFALISTAATGSPPLIVRMIRASSLAQAPCRWMCDRELTMNTMQGHPVQLTLRAVEDNMIRMLAYE